MLHNDAVENAARKLHEAERSAKQIRQLSLDYPETTIEDAYQIQRAWTALRIAEGCKLCGRKVGLTSKAMQLAFKIDEPDYGTLFDDMFIQDGADIPMSRFILPRVEVELGFVLGKRLQGPNCTIFDVLNATDYVVPALEIIDFRVEQLDRETKVPRRVTDMIADNAAGAAVVSGGRPVKPMDIDLRWVSAICYRDGVIEDSGVSAAVMNHPANTVAWLANKLASHGEALEAGSFILSGSFTTPVAARSGDTFQVDYGPLGNITCRFV